MTVNFARLPPIPGFDPGATLAAEKSDSANAISTATAKGSMDPPGATTRWYWDEGTW